MPDRPDLNGHRIRHPNGAVFLILDGKRRHIPDPPTFDSLFRNWDGIITDINVEEITDGGALTQGAVLAKPDNSPAVFLVSNNQKRHIASPAAMDKYNFSWQRIITVPHVLLDFIGTEATISLVTSLSQLCCLTTHSTRARAASLSSTLRAATQVVWTRRAAG